MGNKQQQGFTLIELIMVIVILGILAATALPKFVNLSGDARKATLEGMLGSVKSTLSIVHSKAIIDGNASKAAVTVTIEGVSGVNLVYGYPKDATELLKMMNYDTNAFAITAGNITHKTATTPAKCAITYTAATSATTPATAALVSPLDCS